MAFFVSHSRYTQHGAVISIFNSVREYTTLYVPFACDERPVCSHGIHTLPPELFRNVELRERPTAKIIYKYLSLFFSNVVCSSLGVYIYTHQLSEIELRSYTETVEEIKCHRPQLPILHKAFQVTAIPTLSRKTALPCCEKKNCFRIKFISGSSLVIVYGKQMANQRIIDR